MRRTRPLAAALLATALLLAACAPREPPPDRVTLEPETYAALPGWETGEVAPALAALRRSCARLAALAEDTPVGPDGTAGAARDWRGPCAALVALAADPGDEAARRFFEAWFRPYRVGNNGRSEGLFTGYYEPELNGARTRGGPYATPLLRRPADLVTVELGEFRREWRGERVAGRVVAGRLKPYESRAEIERGALDAERLALCWVDDPVDAFFLQIQGSGRVRLPDGSLMRVGYDGQNGQPYVAIGKLLVERGALPRDAVTMPAIRQWIKANPEAGRALMAENPSYVFFREVAGEGPLGTEGVALTPGRSLAVDRRFIPLGAPLWLDLSLGEERLRRLVVAQDTGGAIRGPVRGDLFWGAGPEAEQRAGTMKARGSYHLLLPKGVAPATAAMRGGIDS